MADVVYVDYESADVTITVAVNRLENAPSTVLTAARLFDDYCGSVRAVMRDYKNPLAPYLPLSAAGNAIFGVRFIKRAGSSREIDTEFWLEILRLRFSLEIATLPESTTVADAIVDAKERHIAKAVQDCLKAAGIPDTFIPEDVGTRGETWIDIVAEMGPELNRGPFVTHG